MINKNSLTIILLIVILVIVAIVLAVIGDFFGETQSKEVKITTEKQEYAIGQAIKIKIENNSEKKICFSSASCYPYYLEKKEEDKWTSYSYSDCSSDNSVEVCIDSKGVKAFELVPITSLPLMQWKPGSIISGVHRLAIPVCNECNIGEVFKEDQWFYSDEFIIK